MVRGVLEEHGYEEPVFIGEGSFAKVYRIRDEEGCFWACRVSEYSGQWERECRNWQEIRHPLFPMYREHWTQDGMGYLIIEFWDGMDLRKMLDRRGRLSPVTALNVTLQITEGLQYLHEREHPFLYRDLKPENIRIRENGRAGILDLGCLWNRERKVAAQNCGDDYLRRAEKTRPGYKTFKETAPCDGCRRKGEKMGC